MPLSASLSPISCQPFWDKLGQLYSISNDPAEFFFSFDTIGVHSQITSNLQLAAVSVQNVPYTYNIYTKSIYSMYKCIEHINHLENLKRCPSLLRCPIRNKFTFRAAAHSKKHDVTWCDIQAEEQDTAQLTGTCSYTVYYFYVLFCLIQLIDSGEILDISRLTTALSLARYLFLTCILMQGLHTNVFKPYSVYDLYKFFVRIYFEQQFTWWKRGLSRLGRLIVKSVRNHVAT